MADLNRTSITGRLVKDVDIPTSTGTTEYVFFTVANNGYKKEDTSFIKCRAWGNIAKYLSQYGKKGNVVAVEGQLKTWKKNDGSYDWNVNVTGATLYGKVADPSAYETNAEETNDSNEIPYPTEIDEDDVPF